MLVRFFCLLIGMSLIANACASKERDFSGVSSEAKRKNRSLIFAAHPDDETLMAGGVIKNALSRREDVTVVIFTNGDCYGEPYPHILKHGIERQGESIDAMRVLGLVTDSQDSEDRLDEHNVIFLAYGSAYEWGTFDLFRSVDGHKTMATQCGISQTYGERGLGGKDFHSLIYGVPGNYSRDGLLADLVAVLKKYRPDDIYTTSLYDEHPDHKAAFLFMYEAIATLRAKGEVAEFKPRLHQTIIHSIDEGYWPSVPAVPSIPIPKPKYLDMTTLAWDARERLMVPLEMQSSDPTRNLKTLALKRYRTQEDPWNYFFVRQEEIFWPTDVSQIDTQQQNIAIFARVEASSESRESSQHAARAVDGIASGWPLLPGYEWASEGEKAGAWIRLEWSNPMKMKSIELLDRPNKVDHILKATLTFSDGSAAIQVAALPNDGTPLRVDFPEKTVEWVQLKVDEAAGENIGLSEFRVLGTF